MGDDFDEKTPQQLLIHPSEHPQVDTFLAKNKKDSLTKYETRNLPQFLVEKDVNDCDDDAEWKIFFGMILE